jgi:AcrR family transcriptional regulator
MTKKQLIIEKAIELFATKGIEATSIQQITEQCGISKGAFYLSFKSKDELIDSIIDYFMQQITAEIDRVVRSNENPQVKLYNFYFTMFQLLTRYTDFAKVFISEQHSLINESLLEKIYYYDHLTNKTIISLLDEIYGSNIKSSKYDLLILIKGFINAYLQIVFSNRIRIDIEHLAHSLVEKTNLLAHHAKITVINESLYNIIQKPFHIEITNEQIFSEINKLIDYVDTSLEKESLCLLKDHLLMNPIKLAIVLGLLKNLEHNEHCQWLIYLVKQKYLTNYTDSTNIIDDSSD